MSVHYFSSNNSKMLTKDTFHWLELITEILSLVQEKQPLRFFNISETLPEYQ